MYVCLLTVVNDHARPESCKSNSFRYGTVADSSQFASWEDIDMFKVATSGVCLTLLVYRDHSVSLQCGSKVRT